MHTVVTASRLGLETFSSYLNLVPRVGGEVDGDVLMISKDELVDPAACFCWKAAGRWVIHNGDMYHDKCVWYMWWTSGVFVY